MRVNQFFTYTSLCGVNSLFNSTDKLDKGSDKNEVGVGMMQELRSSIEVLYKLDDMRHKKQFLSRML